MNISDMTSLVRTDLKDENEPYRWSDEELARHILHAVNDFSEALPVQEKAVITTAAGSMEISLSGIDDLVAIEAVEYPLDKIPRQFQSYSFWAGNITLASGEIPDGSNASIYYGGLHTLDATTSTIPKKHEDLISTGASGYAALEWAAFAINRINLGGDKTVEEFLRFGNEKLEYFRNTLKQLGRRNALRIRHSYSP